MDTEVYRDEIKLCLRFESWVLSFHKYVLNCNPAQFSLCRCIIEEKNQRKYCKNNHREMLSLFHALLEF